MKRSGTLPIPALVAVLLTLLLGAAPGASRALAEVFHPALDPELFPVPESLHPNVEFWRQIFSRYSSTESLIHDDRHVDVVYAVVDSRDLVEAGHSRATIERLHEKRVQEEVERYRKVLRALGGDRRVQAERDDMLRVSELLADLPGDVSKFREAARRVRGQKGLKDHFAEAIEISGMFMPGIERALAAHGVPTIVKCMPFVESMFNYKARSKVGASGAWQFTRGTGALYLQIDSAVDARSDILLAADGAARLLADNYRKVQSWPLALTGYNHGIVGMQRAVRKLGTRDMGVISERYQSRNFGFASRNFYAEFVAAVTVWADRDELFPQVRPRPELRFQELAIDAFVSLLDLAQLTSTELDQLEELNPALDSEVFAGRLLVPRGYRLRVPEGRLASFEQAYADLPAERRLNRQLATRYRVRRGDTLGRIARRFDTSVRALQQANNLPRADRIYIGQMLEIPTGGSLGPLVMPSPVRTAEDQIHTVRPGETLTRIASRYGVGVETLARVNRLSSPDRLQVGQSLTIPGTASSSGQRTHQVERGDTLARLAAIYGTTVQSIMRSNGLTSTLIRVGQILRIPS